MGFGRRSRSDGQCVHIQARQKATIVEIYAVHVLARRVRTKRYRTYFVIVFSMVFNNIIIIKRLQRYENISISVGFI